MRGYRNEAFKSNEPKERVNDPTKAIVVTDLLPDLFAAASGAHLGAAAPTLQSVLTVFARSARSTVHQGAQARIKRTEFAEDPHGGKGTAVSGRGYTSLVRHRVVPFPGTSRGTWNSAKPRHNRHQFQIVRTLDEDVVYTPRATLIGISIQLFGNLPCAASP